MVVCGAYWVNQGVTKPGSIIAFLTYFTIILNAMMSVNKMFVMLSQATASANRIAEVMNLPEERPAGASIESPIKEGVVFDDVCFSYAQPANGYTLEHISFHLKKGQVLGVIGATGSGKTTLIQLLQRFYPVDSGAIYIEGKNINSHGGGEASLPVWSGVSTRFLFHGRFMIT